MSEQEQESSLDETRLNDAHIDQTDYSDICQVDFDRQESSTQSSTENIVSDLRDGMQSMRMPAIITQVSEDYPGEYTVDIYGAGFGSDPTMGEVIVHTSDVNRLYYVDNRVKIKLMSTGSGIILADEIPSPTAFGQMFIAVDDNGTMAWDYGRFVE